MMGQVGRSGMGSHKHGISGRVGKSPKMRMWQRLEAQRTPSRKKKKPGRMFESVYDLFHRNEKERS